jgi:hypothetical protein
MEWIWCCAAGLLRGIGPELVSAASDNDPTNVGTAAAVGAQTGYQLSWVALMIAPLLGIVLTIAAQGGMRAALVRRPAGSRNRLRRRGWPAPAQAEAASSSLTVTKLYPASVMDATSRSSCLIRLAFGSGPPS